MQSELSMEDSSPVWLKHRHTPARGKLSSFQSKAGADKMMPIVPHIIDNKQTTNITIAGLGGNQDI